MTDEKDLDQTASQAQGEQDQDSDQVKKDEGEEDEEYLILDGAESLKEHPPQSRIKYVGHRRSLPILHQDTL